MTWTTTEKQPTHGPCPECGASSMNHLTTVKNGEIGRICGCGAEFPITLPNEGQPHAKRKVYLGDAVYAEFDGHGIVLTTEDGLRETNRIVLEPEVLAALLEFVPKELMPRAR